MVDPLDTFLRALDLYGCNPKQNGHQYQASCPAHDDDDPSLSIGVGDDGRVLVYCFAGCTAKEVVEAVGLTLRDLFPERGLRR